MVGKAFAVISLSCFFIFFILASISNADSSVEGGWYIEYQSNPANLWASAVCVSPYDGKVYSSSSSTQFAFSGAYYFDVAQNGNAFYGVMPYMSLSGSVSGSNVAFSVSQYSPESISYCSFTPFKESYAGVLNGSTITGTMKGYLHVSCQYLYCMANAYADWGGPFSVDIDRVAVAQQKTPWILVHGWKGSQDSWADFEKFLDEDGIPHASVALSPEANPEVRAKELELELEVIREREGWYGKVDIVAHSQGGLDARAFVRNMNGVSFVDSLVMIGTPNHGSFLGNIAGVNWLTPGYAEKFNERTGFDEDVKYYTIAGDASNPLSGWLLSGKDDGVVPVKSVIIEDKNVENLGTFPYEHSELIEKRDVYDAVKNKIDPEYVEVPENISFIKIKTGKISPGGSLEEEVIIDKLNETAFMLITDGNASFQLKTPSGNVIDAGTSSPNVSYLFYLGAAGATSGYIIKSPEMGTWKAITNGSSAKTNFSLFVSAKTSQIISGKADKYFYNTGEPVKVSANLSIAASISKMKLTIIRPDCSESVIDLYDDGLHNDNLANDRIYGNAFTPSAEGGHKLIFYAEGTMPEKFSRSAMESILVIPNKTSFINIASEDVVDVNNNSLYDYLVIVPMLNVTEEGNYSIYGILRNNGAEVARSVYMANDLTPGGQALGIFFEGSDIYSGKLNASYSLDLRFIDEDGNYVGGKDNAYVTSFYNYTQFEPPFENPVQKLAGDVNGDCRVDIFDLAKVGLCYGCLSAQACWQNCQDADVRADSKIDIFDLATVGLNYGRMC